MSNDQFSALTAIAVRLVGLASEDPQLRYQLRQLAQTVLAVTEMPGGELICAPAEPKPADATEDGESPSVDERDRVAAPDPELQWQAEVSAEASAPLPELTLGRSAPSVESPVLRFPIDESVTTDVDIAIIESRCRLKAEGARWAATRRRLISEGAVFCTEIDPIDRDIIARANAVPNCFLWMCHPSGPSPSDPRQYEQVAACFEVLADALAVVRRIQDEPDLYQNRFERSLDLLAEAKSALRVAIDKIGGPSDTDQLQVFRWLTATASKNQFFIRRYMRSDDPADAAQWENLSSRIDALDSWLQETRRRASQSRKLLGKIRHKLSLISSDPEGAAEQWRLVASAVDELVREGLPPSNRELRELLVPAIENLPELLEVPTGFQTVLREIDRFMATCSPSEVTPTAEPTPAVGEVAHLLRGRSMVIIGGDRRPGPQQALKSAFGLRELIWIATREHQSINRFEPYIARSDVAVVILAIRWSSHSFGEIREFCDRHKKPLVRLPGGYNQNQVAAQIMTQCSERLQRE